MVSGEPLVSVVIPTINRPELFVRAVRSALAQTLDPIEVIVVIDGPDEATKEALVALNLPRLLVKSLPCNMGIAEARNAGVDAARGRWIAFLDDDDEWLPDKLEIQLCTPSIPRFNILLSRAISSSGAKRLMWCCREDCPRRMNP